MNVVAIIAEYNPFHNGHLYQLMETKKQTNCDFIVSIMSGNFTQRGLPCLLDKFTRTKMALANGIDLVIELPLPFATGSAERFAQAAVHTLDKTNTISYLSFGSESGNLALLQHIAQVVYTEPSLVSESIHSYLKLGLSFPTARCKAIADYLTKNNPDYNKESIITIMQHPNNILAIEYLKALLTCRSSITPFTITRTTSGYHDIKIHDRIASATAIRHEILYGDKKQIQKAIPKPSWDLLLDEYSVPTFHDLAPFFYYALMFAKKSDLYAFWDIPKDLCHSIWNAFHCYSDFSTIVDKLTSKTYTRATIQRAILRIILQIKSANIMPLIHSEYTPYIRVLGCRKSALPLLSAISKNASVPIITNVGRCYSNLNSSAQMLLTLEQQATSLYSYLANTPKKANADFKTPFFICPS